MKILLPFPGSSFKGRPFVGTVIKENIEHFSSVSSLPANVLLRVWDRIFIRM